MARRIDSIEAWLDVATSGLAKESEARVRDEIQAHFDSSHEEALANGAADEQANTAALAALGDAKKARRAYKRTYVTAWEQRLVREDQWVAGVLCRRGYLLGIPLSFLCSGTILITHSPSFPSFALLLIGIGASFIFGVPMCMPINTKMRGRIYRSIRWTWFVVAICFAYVPSLRENFSAEFAATGVFLVWSVVWVEWSRASMRRKLPIADWPRGLYL